MIVLGTKAMEYFSRPFDLKGILGAWNFALFLFSLVGSIRTLPYTCFLLSNFNLKDQICINPINFGDGSTGLWLLLFVLSKWIEFGDTIFIILRKRKLIFLHWYHHVTVFFISFYGWIHGHPGLYFATINYMVHTIMYFYFAYVAFGFTLPRWFKPHYITVAQITQMVIGTFLTCLQVRYKVAYPDTCWVDWKSLTYVGMIYVTYLYLFVHFMIVKHFTSSILQREKLSKTN